MNGDVGRSFPMYTEQAKESYLYLSPYHEVHGVISFSALLIYLKKTSLDRCQRPDSWQLAFRNDKCFIRILAVTQPAQCSVRGVSDLNQRVGVSEGELKSEKTLFEEVVRGSRHLPLGYATASWFSVSILMESLSSVFRRSYLFYFYLCFGMYSA